MILTEVMDGLAGLITMPNVYAWPAESVSVPCAIIGYPETYEFDLTYGRTDRCVIPVWLVVGKTASPTSRNSLSDALSGVLSLKEALDGPQTFGDVRCTDAEVRELSIAGVNYIALKISAEVI
jgi:hypothetical protein